MPGHVEHVAHDLPVSPPGRELRLAGFTRPRPMSATAPWVTVQNVPGALRADAESITRRAVVRRYRVPTRTPGSPILSVVIALGVLAMGRAQRLEVLRPAPRFGRFRPRASIGVRSAQADNPLRPLIAGPAVVRSV